MLQIILLIVGILELDRRPKIRSLSAEQFPGLPSDIFRAWQDLTLSYINRFLWATWGVFALSIVGMILANGLGMSGDVQLILQVLFLALFLISLLYAKAPGNQAKTLEKQMLMLTGSDYFEVAQLLFVKKSGLNEKDKSGLTRLHIAAIRNHRDVAGLLLANHALVDAQGKDGGTPLHYAAFNGNLEVAELLLAYRAQVNAKDNDGETPLRLAKEEGHLAVVELLRRHGAYE